MRRRKRTPLPVLQMSPRICPSRWIPFFVRFKSAWYLNIFLFLLFACLYSMVGHMNSIKNKFSLPTATPAAQQRRHLGEHYDENIPARHCSFVVTADNRFIVAAGFWDNSFRIFNSDTGKIVQVNENDTITMTVMLRS